MDQANNQGRWTVRLTARPLVMILPGLFYLANLIRMLMITSTPYFIALYAVGGIGILMAVLSREYKLDSIWSFFAFYGLTLVINWLTVGNISFSSIAVNILLTGITLIMLLRQWTYREGMIVFYLFAAIMVYEMNTALNRRILVSSTNYISVLMLLTVAFYYIAIELDGRKLRLIDILPALICFLIAIWARGRGGILSTAILLGLMLLLYMRSLSDKRAKRLIMVILVLLVVGIFLIITDGSIIDAFMSLGKWKTRGTDNSARATIWSAYFSKMGESFGYFLIGAPLRDIPVILEVGENCHNSFLQLHAYNGIYMLIVFLALLVKAYVYYWKNEKFVIIAMMTAIVVRGMTDKFIFGQYGMPIMLFFVLFPFIDRQIRAKASGESDHHAERGEVR